MPVLEQLGSVLAPAREDDDDDDDDDAEEDEVEKEDLFSLLPLLA